MFDKPWTGGMGLDGDRAMYDKPGTECDEEEDGMGTESGGDEVDDVRVTGNVGSNSSSLSYKWSC